MASTYRLFVGAPCSVFFLTVGAVLCITIVGIPAGLVAIGIGLRFLTLGEKISWRFSDVCYCEGLRGPSVMVLLGLLLTATIIGLPLGLPMVALGLKRLMAAPRPA